MSCEDNPDHSVKVGPVSIATSIGVLVLMAFVYASYSTAASAQAGRHMTGIAAVTDGNTLRIGEDRIRLNGIDAPENGSVCQGEDVYAQSRAVLAALTAQNTIDSTVGGTDRYNASRPCAASMGRP